MQLNQLLSSNNLPSLKEEIEITGLACDSRKVEKGFLFAALSGSKTNGSEFIKDACEKGAVAVLIEEGTPCEDFPVCIIPVKNVRLCLAKMAGQFYTPTPQTVVAITGTNGKTSTASFTRQILEYLGQKSASIGTLGVVTNEFSNYGSLTTPDTITLHQSLKQLASKGYNHVAIEASSHGIEQHRISGISLTAAAFTNITQDHLDYHGTMEKYLDAKLKLFDLPFSSGSVVLNADIQEFDKIASYCKERDLKIIDYGKKAKALCLKDTTRTLNGQELHLEVYGKAFCVKLPLAGEFQAMNALCSLGLVLTQGIEAEKAIEALELLKGVDGRLDYVGERKNHASVYVDYAHTPDALETVLKALRPHTDKKLQVVFGCGGDRDTTKRPKMGAICEALADVSYVTDDNPRSEDPTLIRSAILSACPSGINIASRALAIKTAVQNLEQDNILVVAGKGHETGQLIKGVMHPFNDKEEVLKAIEEADTPLWTAKEIKEATNAQIEKDFDIFGLSIDTRTIKEGDLFIALKGEKMDGHNYLTTALEKGASGVLVSTLPADISKDKVILVEDTLKALEKMAKHARARSQAKIIGITGSSGKTSTKEMLKTALTSVGKTHTTKGNFNNNIGLPLTLALMPKQTEFAVIEMGMNHTGEMRELTAIAKPDIAMITMVGSAHSEFFKTQEETAFAKAEIFEGMDADSLVFLNADNAHFDLLKKEAEKNNLKHILSFGSKAENDISLLELNQTPLGYEVHVKAQKTEYTYTLKLSGLHQVQNSLGVIGILSALNIDMPTVLQSLGQLAPAKGRGATFELNCEKGRYFLIDDAYNANPESMKAGLKVLGSKTPQNNGRRVAILGDMLELGDQSETFHLSLKNDLIENNVDVLYTVGKYSGALFDKVPVKMQGIKKETIEELAFIIQKEVKPNDIVFVKSSAGSGMARIVETLKNASEKIG